MTHDLGTFITTGTLARAPVSTLSPAGVSMTSLTVRLVDPTRPEGEYPLRVLCDSNATADVEALSLREGDAVTIGGKLLRGEQREERSGELRPYLVCVARIVLRTAAV